MSDACHPVLYSTAQVIRRAAPRTMFPGTQPVRNDNRQSKVISAASENGTAWVAFVWREWRSVVQGRIAVDPGPVLPFSKVRRCPKSGWNRAATVRSGYPFCRCCCRCRWSPCHLVICPAPPAARHPRPNSSARQGHLTTQHNSRAPFWSAVAPAPLSVPSPAIAYRHGSQNCHQDPQQANHDEADQNAIREMPPTPALISGVFTSDNCMAKKAGVTS